MTFEEYIASGREAHVMCESREEEIRAVIFGKSEEGFDGLIEIIYHEEGKYCLQIENMEWVSDDLDKLSRTLWECFGKDLYD